MTREQHERCSATLEKARLDREPIEPLTDTWPDLSIADAYAISQVGIAARLDSGARIVGHKIGLTSIAVQEQLGVDQPDYGALLDDMQVDDQGSVADGELVSPRVELELAFHLGESLRGPDVTVDDVQRATASVQPSIEIVDSRIADWRIKLADTVADNASAGAYVLGGNSFTLDEFDVTAVDITLEQNGEVVERGRSDAVLGDPRTAVAWLANALTELGGGLEAGHVVLSGACTRMVSASPGDSFSGDFGQLGTVSVSFEGASR